MSFAEFEQSARGSTTPAGLSAPLLALWHAGRGDWKSAHETAQADKSRDGSWVHAYLHREEGDPGNAGYWYARAGRPRPAAGVTLKEEWAALVRHFLES